MSAHKQHSGRSHLERQIIHSTELMRQHQKAKELKSSRRLKRNSMIGVGVYVLLNIVYCLFSSGVLS